jgi:ankyrin repeat protein
MKHLQITLLSLLLAAPAVVGGPPTTRRVELDGAEPGGLYEAAVTGDAAAVKRLLAAGAKADDNRNKFGATPLMAAADRGDIEVLRALIEKGADVNAETNEHRVSVLQYAASTGRLEAAVLLVEKGADVRHAARSGETPLLDAVVFGGSPSYVRGGGSVGLAKFLIEKGADVNTPWSSKGGTVLHGAVVRGNKRMAELLIEKGADVNARDGLGRTPLYLARRWVKRTHEPDATAIVDLLAERGAREAVPADPATKPVEPSSVRCLP